MPGPLYVIRDELYKQVWSEPMTTISKRYQISDVALAKICRKMEVPIPGRGYWAKIASGQKLTVPPLPAASDDVPQRVEVSPPQPQHWKTASDEIDPIPVQAILISPHPLTIRLRTNLAKKHPDRYGRVSSDSTEISAQVSPTSVPRLLTIVDAFVKVAEERGFIFRSEKSYNGEYLGIVIGGRPVHFLFMERSRRSSEVKSPLRYRPQDAAADYIPTGRLCFKILEYVFDRMEPTWCDSARNPPESRLGEILLALHKAAEELRERDERNKREHEKLQAAQRAQRMAEFQHKKLMDDLDSWSAAEALQRMITQLETSLADMKVQDPAHAQRWLEWARDKAADLDPFSSGLDAFFEQYQPDPDRLPTAFALRGEQHRSATGNAHYKIRWLRR